jgi:hypothetical protein
VLNFTHDVPSYGLFEKVVKQEDLKINLLFRQLKLIQEKKMKRKNIGKIFIKSYV